VFGEVKFFFSLIIKLEVHMVNKFKALLATAMIAVSFSANAGIITNGAALTDYDHFENFETGTNTNNLSGKFGTNGLSFKTLAAGGIALTTAGTTSCNQNGRGVSGKYLGMGLTVPCLLDTTTVNSVSIMFDKDVAELSWLGFSLATGQNQNGVGYIIEAFNDGKAVEGLNTVFGVNNRFTNKYVNISGGVFDELRFTETSAYQGIFGIDNMAWKNAVVTPPPSDVPEPSIALLFGAGMIGMGVMRKKKQKAA
jgi:hypothetical protein